MVEMISSCIKEGTVLVNEPMSRHTTFKIGGNADVFVQPANREEIAAVLSCCKEKGIPFTVIGNGSNLLVSDKGIRGAVIRLGRIFGEITLCDDETVFAQSGALLSSVASFALNNGLAGFEFASGIPGTVGGALLMNAGAYGGEIKDVTIAGEILDSDGCFRKIEGESQGFGYRTSAYQKLGGVVTGAWFKFRKTDDRDEISRMMTELNRKRKEKQPLEFGSAGSTFKRPEGHFAGKLIEDCGLKGFTVGGAQVSEKHAGFVINRGGATCDDVIRLMRHVRKIVLDETGVLLEPEVKIIGDFGDSEEFSL